MGSDQRRRASRIDRDRRTLEVQVIRDACGRNGRTASSGIADASALQNLAVLVAHDSQINAAAASAEATRCVAGILESVVGLFQEEALLRIHRVGFERRDIEKQ